MPDADGALRSRIEAELDSIKDPCSLAAGTPLGLVEMGLVDEIRIAADGEVEVKLRLTSPFCHMIGFFKQEAVRRIEGLAEGLRVTLSADNGLDWSPAMLSESAQARRTEHLRRMASPAAS